LYRWEFDLKTGKVSERQLDDVSHAFPRVDDRATGLRHRYGWAIAPRPGAEQGFGAPAVLLKYDVERGGSTMHDFGPNAQPGEFVFAESSDSAAEDAGYVLGFVYDKARDTSDLVILDATDMTKAPVATVELPRRVPHGFHGSWIRG